MAKENVDFSWLGLGRQSEEPAAEPLATEKEGVTEQEDVIEQTGVIEQQTLLSKPLSTSLVKKRLKLPRRMPLLR